ncbi:hypothetical protein B9Q03_10365, partial [Candidatus Marsarchaeota G2 archaeon OSP_D]
LVLLFTEWSGRGAQSTHQPSLLLSPRASWWVVAEDKALEPNVQLIRAYSHPHNPTQIPSPSRGE